MISKDLLSILACPICKKSVKETADGLICEHCRKIYPVRDGIPIMLSDQADDLKESHE